MLALTALLSHPSCGFLSPSYSPSLETIRGGHLFIDKLLMGRSDGIGGVYDLYLV